MEPGWGAGGQGRAWQDTPTGTMTKSGRAETSQDSSVPPARHGLSAGWSMVARVSWAVYPGTTDQIVSGRCPRDCQKSRCLIHFPETKDAWYSVMLLITILTQRKVSIFVKSGNCDLHLYRYKFTSPLFYYNMDYLSKGKSKRKIQSSWRKSKRIMHIVTSICIQIYTVIFLKQRNHNE